jgi:hypothetical protein
LRASSATSIGVRPRLAFLSLSASNATAPRTFTTERGAERRIWRQHGRDGIRLVDVALSGRGRRYLIDRALNAGEADAPTADYLAQAAQLGDCPMRTSRTARTLEAMR